MFEVSLRLPIEDVAIDFADKICLETFEFFQLESADEIFFATHEAIINAVEIMKKTTQCKEKDYINLGIRISINEVEIIIEDFGPGIPFETWDELKTKSFDDALLDESGRGLLFIKEFMDEVFAYLDKDDKHTLVLKRKIGVEKWKT